MTKNRDYDKKIFRLVNILNRLDSEKCVYSRNLTEEFNVSMRTIQRDIELLNMAGFLLNSTKKGAYTFAEGFSLKKMRLTNQDASLLTLFFDIARSLGPNFEESFRSIFSKVLAQEHESPFYVKIPEGLNIPRNYPFLKKIEEAIDGSEKILIHYKSHIKEGDYKLCPLKVIFIDGFWYLLAHPEGKKWLTKFRLENITSVENIGGYFVPPQNLRTILDESINILFPDKRDKVVALRIDKEITRYFKKRKYFPLQRIKKTNKDGSLIVETKVGNYEEILPVIFRWIPNISVAAPLDLKEKVIQEIKKYLGKI